MDYCLILLRLIRFKNLVIIAAIQALSLKVFCITTTTCSMISAISVMILSLLVSAGGYIINDLCDVEIDEINKPQSRVVGKELSTQHVRKLYAFVLLSGLLLSVQLDLSLRKNFWTGLYLALSVVCFVYSFWFKKSFLLGNLIVAGMSGLVAIIVLFPYLSTPFQVHQLPRAIVFICIFSVIVTFYREIVKDIEDVVGDRTHHARTIPIVLGTRHTKKILVALNMTIMALLFPFFNWDPLSMKSIMHCCILTSLLVLYSLLLQKVVKAQQKIDYSKISNLLKISMLLGLAATALAN